MRTHHPFHMYDAIQAQPEAFKAVATKIKIEQLSKMFSVAGRIFLIGTGTSYHVAWASKFILKAAYPGKMVSAQTAIDFALYEDATNERDLVIVLSHRGNKKYSVKSLKKAKAAGALTALITGKQTESKDSQADVVLETVEQEASSAHTVSYTAALAPIVAAVEGPVEELANVLKKGLDLESEMERTAQKGKDARRIWIVGGGPNEVTAKEIALKIKETSYMQTEGVGVEELLHGPFQSAEPEDLFILIAPEGKTKERTLELIPAIQAIGAKLITIGDNKHTADYIVPKVAEEYATISCITPLYLFTYHLTLIKQTNPDNFRLEDPRFAKAWEHTSL